MIRPVWNPLQGYIGYPLHCLTYQSQVVGGQAMQMAFWRVIPRIGLLWAMFGGLAPAFSGAAPFVRCFLFVGQSNMAGSGNVGSSPSRYRAQTDVLFDVTSPATPNTTTDWIYLGAPTSAGGPGGHGPELSFGRILAEAFPDEKIAIVKVSQAATGLGYWRTPGQAGYETMLARIEVAKTRLNAMQSAGSIAGWAFSGFVYMQGENEADGALGPAQTYLPNLTDLVTKVRTAVGVADLPAIIGRISIILDPIYGGPCNQPHLDLVRAAQVDYGQPSNHAAWVNTDDLNVLDVWHFDTLAQLRMGRRMAEAWLGITQTQPWCNVEPDLSPDAAGLPTVRFHVTFSAPVTGFEPADLLLGGSAHPTWAEIMPADPGDGSVYLVTVGGMSDEGTVTLGIPSGAAQGAGGGNFPATSERPSMLYRSSAGGVGLIAHDDFEKAAGPLLQSETGQGFSLAGWGVQNNATTGYLITPSQPLVYGQLRSSPGHATGGNVYMSCARDLNMMDDFIPWEQSRFDDHVTKRSAEIWVSFLARRDTNKDWTLALSRGGGTVNDNQTITVKSSSGRWALLLFAPSQTGVQTADTGINSTVGTVFLHVLQIQFDPTSGGTARLWINPASLGGTAPDPSTAQASLTTTDANFKFRRIFWNPGNAAGDGSLDEIRIGTSFASVTPVRPAQTPYEVWQTAAFSAQEIAGGLADPLAKPAGDGVTNLMKYALGIAQPKNHSRVGLPTVQADGVGPWRFTFRRERSDLLYRVQTSANLIDWQTVATNPGTPGTEPAVTIYESSQTGHLLARLAVSEP